MSEIKDLVSSDRPVPVRHRSHIWTAIVVALTFGLIVLNLLIWQGEQVARNEQRHARQNLSEQTRLLEEAESSVAELDQLRSAMLEKQAKVRTLLRSYRRPAMVRALQAGLVDMELSETVVARATPSPNYGLSFLVWTPDEGQSMSIDVRTGEPEDAPPNPLASDKSDSNFNNVIVEPLLVKQLHVIRYEFKRENNGSELRVTFDGRLLHSRDFGGFRVKSASHSGSYFRDTFSEPNLVSNDSIGRKLSLEQISDGVWMAIYNEEYVLHDQDAKQWKRVSIDCGLRSAGPLKVDRKASLTQGWSRFFDFERYLELRDTSRPFIQEIISVKQPPVPTSEPALQ